MIGSDLMPGVLTEVPQGDCDSPRASGGNAPSSDCYTVGTIRTSPQRLEMSFLATSNLDLMPGVLFGPPQEYSDSSHPISQSLLGEEGYLSIPDHLKTKSEDFLQKIQEGALESFEKGELFLFDSCIKSNQCHMTALRIIKIFESFKQTSELAKSEKKFIVLSFFLSQFFSRQNKLFLQKVKKIRGKKKGEFLQFIQNKTVVQLFKNALGAEIHAYIKQLISEIGLIQLKEELLSMADDQRCLLEGSTSIFTIPKFASVQALVHSKQIERVPTVIKVKVLCEKGSHFNVFFAENLQSEMILKDLSKVTSLTQPVIVIEGFANRRGGSTRDSMKMRNLCSKQFFRKSKRRHSHSCEYCKPCPDSFCGAEVEHLKTFENLKTPMNLLTCDAAVFMGSVQPKFKAEFFSDETSKLTTLLVSHESKAEELGLSQKNPSTMRIEHVYADVLEHALIDQGARLLVQSPRLLDQSPRTMIGENIDV